MQGGLAVSSRGRWDNKIVNVAVRMQDSISGGGGRKTGTRSRFRAISYKVAGMINGYPSVFCRVYLLRGTKDKKGGLILYRTSLLWERPSCSFWSLE